MSSNIFDKSNLQQSKISGYLRDLFEKYTESDCPYDIGYFDEDTENPRYWVVSFIGPEGTPYSGGLFRVRLEFFDDYPNSYPDARFLTKIYHCHVKTPEEGGYICFGTFNNGKQPKDVSLEDFLDILYSIFYNETPHGYYGDRHKLFTENRNEFNRIASQWTRDYATF